MNFRNIIEDTDRTKFILDILNDIFDTLSEAKGTFKDTLTKEINNFNSVDKFYILDGKIGIKGKINKKVVIRQVPFPEPDVQKRKDIIRALNIRMLPKLSKK